jgi:7-keto-8-aminopelargonate synthetase-like enzyme
MFTASLPPSIIASTRSALQRLDRDKNLRTQLMANATQLHNGLHALGLEVGPHVSPVVSVALDEPDVAVRFWNALVEGGVYLNLALPPATPSSRPLLRASVSAAHQPRQIDKAIDLFGTIARELGVLPAASFAAPQRVAIA